jgi:rhodanese-related sulfurtransferase
MRWLPVPLITVFLLLAGCSNEPQMELTGRAAALAQTIAEEQDHVTVPELSDWLIKDRRDFELIDIRETADFDAGHIDRARHVPLAGLMAEDVLASLPGGRKVVVYSNGTAHAAQATLLLRLLGRDAYALLGGFNYWQAYLNDPAAAGVAQMDPRLKAEYQAVSCFFEGDYAAAAGLPPRDPPPQPPGAHAAGGDALGLGLGLGLGPAPAAAAPPAQTDPLGLGLGLGLGGEAAESLRRDAPSVPQASPGRLLIKAEC